MSTLSHLQSLQDTQREGYMPETSPPPPPSEPDALATLQKEYADLIDRFNHTTLRQADTIQAQAIQIGQQRGEIRRLREAIKEAYNALITCKVTGPLASEGKWAPDRYNFDRQKTKSAIAKLTPFLPISQSPSLSSRPTPPNPAASSPDPGE